MFRFSWPLAAAGILVNAVFYEKPAVEPSCWLSVLYIVVRE